MTRVSLCAPSISYIIIYSQLLANPNLSFSPPPSPSPHLFQAEQLECYEFLDLSDVDVRERDQLATTLYARDEDAAEDDEEQQPQPLTTSDSQNKYLDDELETNNIIINDSCSSSHEAEAVAYWRNQQQGRTFSNQTRKSRVFGLKNQPQQERRDLVFGGHEPSEVNGGDSRPVSRTESVLTDISSSYLSSSASSLHVPNNAHQYPASVTSPPLFIGSSGAAACNGGPHNHATTYGEFAYIDVDDSPGRGREGGR